MTLCISTSCPTTSVALFDDEGVLRFSDERLAPRQASGTVLDLVEALDLNSIDLFVADVGPGSFTGVRVGVTMAKSWAWALGRACAGVQAFDLVAHDRMVALASKANEAFVRHPGREPLTCGRDGLTLEEPRAARLQMGCLILADPMTLLPLYVAEPSISQAKQPHIMGETLG